MALEGLFPEKDDERSTSEKSDIQYPKLGVILDYILSQQPKLLDSTEMREQRLVFHSKTYVVMIKFLLNCFESEVEQNKSIEGSSAFWSSVEKMCLLLEHAMAFEGSVELHANASKALIVIGSYIPEVIITFFGAFCCLYINMHFSLLYHNIFLTYFKLFIDDSFTLFPKSSMAKATT